MYHTTFHLDHMIHTNNSWQDAECLSYKKHLRQFLCVSIALNTRLYAFYTRYEFNSTLMIKPEAIDEEKLLEEKKNPLDSKANPMSSVQHQIINQSSSITVHYKHTALLK